MIAIEMQLRSGADPIPAARIVRAGALAAVLAALANTVVRTLAVTLQPVDPGFVALTWAPPALFSVIGALGATTVCWLISRRASRPAVTFTRVAVGALALSLLPDLLLLPGGPLALPGSMPWTVGALMIMHLVAFAIIFPLLRRAVQGFGTAE